MQSIENKILTKINRIPSGSLIFPEDSYALGTSEAIRLELHRLEKKQEITRVAQGIYVRPKISELMGIVIPSAEEVAKAIIKRDHIRTVPTGSYAFNALGLHNIKCCSFHFCEIKINKNRIIEQVFELQYTVNQ